MCYAVYNVNSFSKESVTLMGLRKDVYQTKSKKKWEEKWQKQWKKGRKRMMPPEVRTQICLSLWHSSHHVAGKHAANVKR